MGSRSHNLPWWIPHSTDLQSTYPTLQLVSHGSFQSRLLNQELKLQQLSLIPIRSLIYSTDNDAIDLQWVGKWSGTVAAAIRVYVH